MPATGLGRGSGRSIRGFNLYEAFKACSQTPGRLRRPSHGGRSEHPRRSGARLRRRVRGGGARRDAARGLHPGDLHRRGARPSTRSTTSCSPIWRASSRTARAIPSRSFWRATSPCQSRRIVGENHLKLYLRQGSRALAGHRLRHGATRRRGRRDARRPVLARAQRVERHDLQLRLRDFARLAGPRPATARSAAGRCAPPGAVVSALASAQLRRLDCARTAC